MIRIERVGAVFTAILLLCSILSTSADARSSRSRQVPNGTSLGCVACHVSSGGGGPRNAFGLQIEADFLSQAGFSGVPPQVSPDTLQFQPLHSSAGKPSHVSKGD